MAQGIGVWLAVQAFINMGVNMGLLPTKGLTLPLLSFGGTGIVVIFLDVDGLKHVNDTEGHASGDRLLVDTVATIRKRVRSYDLVIRYGGDEFVCALLEVALGPVRAKFRPAPDGPAHRHARW